MNGLTNLILSVTVLVLTAALCKKQLVELAEELSEVSADTEVGSASTITFPSKAKAS